MSGPAYVATLIAAVGCGLSAGALFAFSAFVIAALGRLPAPQGIAAMQSINTLAVTPVFMTTLFGAGLASLVAAGLALATEDGASAALAAAGRRSTWSASSA